MNSYTNKNHGFTMVELLVVMVIIALLGGVVVPSIGQYINSRTLAEQKKSITMELAALPAQAYFTQQAIIIDSGEKLNSVSSGQIEKNQVTIIEPIQVLNNGFCKGGELALNIEGSEYVLKVNPPLCSVSF